MAKLKIGKWEVEAVQFQHEASIITEAFALGVTAVERVMVGKAPAENDAADLTTPVGRIRLKPGDWLIKNAAGEFDGCDDPTFRNRIDMALLKELISDSCRCGALKEPHKSFCQSCYFRLPTHMQRAMYKRLGKGYREAYEEAVAILGGSDATV